MQKQAPSIGRILVAAGFALSCFGLILFLWVAFGGPTPLASKSYRITAYFPEATQLAVESDVRIGGVSVGKVKEVKLAPASERVEGYDTTEATIEIDPQFAPISEDARAILRQKTLLGETYVELTSGTEPGAEAAPVSLGAAANFTDAQADGVEALDEGATLDVTRTENATQIDEIFNALDDETRNAFQRWQANAAVAIKGRGLDLNDTLGNLGPFIGDASEVLSTLRRQKSALKSMVRDTGTVFAALSERDGELAGAITGSEATFGALADADEALAESFQILPTFQRESRLTLESLDRFQGKARPLVQELLPVANDITPTLRSVRRLSPNLEDLFEDLDPLIEVSRDGLPALERLLGEQGLQPLMDALDPFLANLNPAVRYLRVQKKLVTDFLATPGVALSHTTELVPGAPAPRHYLPQVPYNSAETVAIHPTRLDTNRGNAYPFPEYLFDPRTAARGIFPNFDCKNLDYSPGSGGDPDEDEHYLDPRPGEPDKLSADANGGDPPDNHFAPCFIQGDFPAIFGGGRAPNLFADP
jgi:phospholipid/cholesterol/gamma-HCH transport system substrate-binding protein